MSQISTETELLYSRLGGDPDLAEIVAMFVAEMPDRVATLLLKLSAGDWEGLRRAAHQLKGAAGSYGFDLISPGAAVVENALRNNLPVATIREAVESLVELCRRMRPGTPA